VAFLSCRIAAAQKADFLSSSLRTHSPVCDADRRVGYRGGERRGLRWGGYEIDNAVGSSRLTHSPTRSYSFVVEENTGRVASRQERKARAVMDKIAGLERVHEFASVRMVRQGAVFTVDDPVVYKAKGTDTYVVFGPYGTPDYMDMARQQLATFQGMAGSSGAEGVSGVDTSVPGGSGAAKDAVEEVEDDADLVDETGLEAKDIELVMTQAAVSRSKAVTALKAADGDIVSAIMELTC